MSDVLRVEVDAVPWLPAPGVVAGEVLDFFDVPRAGILHANGASYYFSCILGDARRDEFGVWVYAHIVDSELQRLLAAVGPDESDAAQAEVLRHRWVTVAASRGDCIIDSATFDAGMEGADGLVQRLLKRWERLASTSEQLRGLVAAH